MDKCRQHPEALDYSRRHSRTMHKQLAHEVQTTSVQLRTRSNARSLFGAESETIDELHQFAQTARTSRDRRAWFCIAFGAPDEAVALAAEVTMKRLEPSGTVVRQAAIARPDYMEVAERRWWRAAARARVPAFASSMQRMSGETTSDLATAPAKLRCATAKRLWAPNKLHPAVAKLVPAPFELHPGAEWPSPLVLSFFSGERTVVFAGTNLAEA
jgi:hypothetical protein